MSIQTYLNFNGNCGEALEFYSQVFKTEKPKIMLYGDMPANKAFPMTEETKKLVLHGELKIDGSTIMFSDTAQDMSVTFGNNINLIFTSKDEEEIKRIFNELKTNGKVIMELQKTFWSKCYGYIIDKFGIGWQLSTEE
ncbi:VOC family protein [Clostridium sp. 19966]|uniref:VOC family protein n=1 Tax=Clostridium sp. 19966 TaxID=2768166 RepID=UPI0028DDD3BA|nr:VOC family protein [Clostridium sp. 19966]MDT8718781.1 VOC family protein [Clostridium sp. 19966]